jgi:hypothetical protein
MYLLQCHAIPAIPAQLPLPPPLSLITRYLPALVDLVMALIILVWNLDLTTRLTIAIAQVVTTPIRSINRAMVDTQHAVDRSHL